ncbi:MAG: histidine kinase [Brumimicrobium sp.]|nr:histidine kinase [Brumimicrobium sp.]
MKKASFAYWMVQIISWGLFCGMVGIASFVQGDFKGKTPYKLIELFFLLILVSHGIRYVLLRLDWINLKLAPLLPRVLLLNIFAAVLLVFLINISSLIIFGVSFIPFLEFIINVSLYTIFFIMWSAVYLTYHLMAKSRKQELHSLKLEASHHEIELKTLRDQLNPHFLFNSLNSIRALIEIDPATAKGAITTLSNLLRNSLQMGKRTQVSLADEINLVQEYLRLEKIRFEERLNYSLEVDVPSSLQIPPFIIQTMTENAIKHGISKKSDGGIIDIHIFEEGDRINLQVINTGGTYIPDRKEGIGISNLTRRLQIQYGDDAGFSLKNDKTRVVACAWIAKNKVKHTI